MSKRTFTEIEADLKQARKDRNTEAVAQVVRELEGLGDAASLALAELGRGYLAVAGGIDVPRVLGSRSPGLRSPLRIASST